MSGLKFLSSCEISNETTYFSCMETMWKLTPAQIAFYLVVFVSAKFQFHHSQTPVCLQYPSIFVLFAHDLFSPPATGNLGITSNHVLKTVTGGSCTVIRECYRIYHSIQFTSKSFTTASYCSTEIVPVLLIFTQSMPRVQLKLHSQF